jgi:phosphotransferase family enzyme
MILSAQNVFYYLLDQGLISLESLVDGDFMVVDASSRHRNFKIIRRESPSYFVKQVKEWDPQTIATLQCEATCYRLAHGTRELNPLAVLMPRYHVFDPERQVLVIELIPGSESVAEYHRRLGRFPTEVGSRLGELLGSYHRDAVPLPADHPQAAVFARRIPWVLSLHQLPAGSLGMLSGANARLLDIVHGHPGFRDRLDRLQREWRPDRIVHGDIKWENCLVFNGADTPAGPTLKLVDWEVADLGDASWDVGAIFQCYLVAWIASMPLSPDVPPAQLIARARYPLEDMRPAIQAFWRSYVATRGLDREEERPLLERSVEYAAARMIQTAYEWMHESATMTTNNLCFLQVSLNVLTNPADAARDLLAL